MLNRQTVKNAVIPLIPGEMKVTIVDQAMLQVARRGESASFPLLLFFFSCSPLLLKRILVAAGLICETMTELRTAIWFSEGAEAVDRFRSAVLR